VKSNGDVYDLRDEILITGSLYRSDILVQLLQAILAWQKANPGTKFLYARGNKNILEQAMSSSNSAVDVKNLGRLSPHDLWERQRNVRINVYVRKPPNLFYHKLLELLAADRPILAYPGETDESHSIAKSVNRLFFSCEDQDRIHHALDQTASTADASRDSTSLGQFSSQYKAKKLSELFSETIKRHGNQP
jgi:hypothetical protein